ncbi:MAG: sodium:proline symporter [Haloferacaceae archaeon]
MVETGVALVAVTGTLVAFAVVGAWAARGRVESVESFVTARGSLGTAALTGTVVASSMGAWILFSPPEAGAAFGGITAVVGYAAGSALSLAAYAVVGPRIRALLPAGHGVTDFARARFGDGFAAYVLFVSAAYMFVFLAAEFTGIAAAVTALAGVPGWQTAALVGVTVFAYTAYGGLRASVATDVLQTVLILPLLAVVVGAALFAAGGPGAVVREAAAADPSLVNPTYAPGLRFAAYVVVAVVSAELLNQAWWQRVYASRDEQALRRGYLLAAVLVFPVVLGVGLFGLVAVGRGLEGPASASLFLVVEALLPDSLVLAVAVLATLLVASSADTLFNGLASLVTVDLPRVVDVADENLTLVARAATGVVALGATVVGAQGYSVLTLFLLADLIAAATVVPLFHGLFSRRAWSGGAVVASAAGLVAGLAFFPPARAVLPAGLPAASFLRAFALAVSVSGATSLLAARLANRRFDLGSLEAAGSRLDARDD